MVGLISIGDVVAARLSELAMEKDALDRDDHGQLSGSRGVILHLQIIAQ
jgi:hypothetical protein